MDSMRRHGDTAKNTDLRQRRKRPIYDNGTAVQSAEGMLWIGDVMDVMRRHGYPPQGYPLQFFFVISPPPLYDVVDGEKHRLRTTARGYRAWRGCYGYWGGWFILSFGA